MGKKILLTCIVVVLIVAAAGAAYLYYPLLMPQASVQTTQNIPTSKPDNSVAAGPVTAISETKITIRKQDGSSATFTIASTTAVKSAGTSGQSGDAKISAIHTGVMVLITPSSAQATLAQTIILISPPPPAQ